MESGVWSEAEACSNLDSDLKAEHARKRVDKMEWQRASTTMHGSPRSTEALLWPAGRPACLLTTAKTCTACSAGRSKGAAANHS